MSKISDPIFKRDSHGNVRVWSYEVDGAKYRTMAGIKGGTIVTSDWTECKAKSQATDELQAEFEAEALRKHKLERTYHASERNIDNPIIFSPMLAKEFGREQKKVTYPCISQPKLDGIRCIATSKGLFTRQGKAITAVPHIEESLEKFFDVYPDAILDGELYNHSLKDDFNTIASVVRRQSNSDEDLARSVELMQYHIYDAYGEDDWATRNASYRELLKKLPHIFIVETTVALNEQHLTDLYAMYMENGYEGQMVRLAGAYENKRSGLLLKRKEFQDAEFEVVSILPGTGNWSGYAKRAVLKLPDGRSFGAGIKGTQEAAEKLLEQAETYVGGKATVRFFAYTPDGVPRFPVITDVRTGEKVD